MALNLEAMKAKLNKLNGKGEGKKNFWRPEEGESNIRIVSTPDGDPFKERYFHYGVGVKTVTKEFLLEYVPKDKTRHLVACLSGWPFCLIKQIRQRLNQYPRYHHSKNQALSYPQYQHC